MVYMFSNNNNNNNNNNIQVLGDYITVKFPKCKNCIDNNNTTTTSYLKFFHGLVSSKLNHSWYYCPNCSSLYEM